MEKGLKDIFLYKWRKYFGNAELPVTYFYSDETPENKSNMSGKQEPCLICKLNMVREGQNFVYSSASPGCPGGKRYTGFATGLRSNFEYFLSCGLPGKIEGERYKKSPELVKDYLKNNPPFRATAKYLIFKRWDNLITGDKPAAAIFFATPDILSGLFTLANYDRSDPDGVIAPMGSGCSSIVSYPLAEAKSQRPRCVLGMFDVSARPCTPSNTLTLTIPIKRLNEMVENMDESFLITESWDKVKQRIGA